MAFCITVVIWIVTGSEMESHCALEQKTDTDHFCGSQSRCGQQEVRKGESDTEMGSEEAQPEAGAEKTRLELNHDCNSKVGLVIQLLIVEQPDNRNYQ